MTVIGHHDSVQKFGPMSKGMTEKEGMGKARR